MVKKIIFITLIIVFVALVFSSCLHKDVPDEEEISTSPTKNNIQFIYLRVNPNSTSVTTLNLNPFLLHQSLAAVHFS